MRLRSILWALALCGAGWTPNNTFSQEPVRDVPSFVTQAEKSKIAKEAIPTQLPNLIPAPDFKSADKPFEPARPADSSKPIERPLVTPPALEKPPTIEEMVSTPVLPPLGFTGKSSVLSDIVGDNDYVPMPDRWRMGFPALDRYGLGHPPVVDYPFQLGHWWDPYNQNVLKGDYPIYGQHTFFNFTGSVTQITQAIQSPIGTTPFESTARPFEEQFFGNPNQLANLTFMSFSFDLFHGDAAYKPVDWRLKATPIFNVNTLNVNELAVVNPNVLKRTQRDRDYLALEEWFAETKLVDLSAYYDFMSARVGSQPFNADFRGFLFNDINRAVRIFGTRNDNRDQFNLAYFRQQEKDTNSGLNTFRDRGTNLVFANYYRQDFIWPGYTAQVSTNYYHDDPTFLFDRNSFLIRPDPVGVFPQHTIDAVYFGWAGDGHIERFNVSHQMYYVMGYDTFNPLAGQAQDIRAAMAACELSYDRDYARFRTSFFWSSGDRDITNSHASGFDTIFENSNFAGGPFSYWQRQSVKLFGVNLVNSGSLIPDLRSSRIQGQANYVNPGLLLYNLGFDLDINPKLKMINNCNFLWLESSAVVEQYVFAGGINNFIGNDLSSGFEYRPFLNNNAIMTVGVSTLIPGSGFKALYNNPFGTIDPLVAGFAQLTLTY
ncbi:MAG: hypothetical protein EBT92_07385 [Planctomycetes bacterium]|nr:hypothetical protein [Planctomycetota bacterium]